MKASGCDGCGRAWEPGRDRRVTMTQRGRGGWTLTLCHRCFICAQADSERKGRDLWLYLSLLAVRLRAGDQSAMLVAPTPTPTPTDA